MYDLFNLPGTLFDELERMHRLFDDPLSTGRAASIRAGAPGAYPGLNVGHTPTSVEVYAFAPGLDAKTIDLVIDRGVLTLSGERKAPDARPADGSHAHTRERSFGHFRRTLSLPDDIDPSRVTARYEDGVLRVSIARREDAQPRRIAIH